jgi:CheY-like chemotaxis protein
MLTGAPLPADCFSRLDKAESMLFMSVKANFCHYMLTLTSFAMQGDKEKFMSVGFDGYLSKPINSREQPGLVKQWLEEEQL